MHWPGTEEVWKPHYTCQSHLTRLVDPMFSDSPDPHSGLDQGCDSDRGEDGSNQLTHGVLISPNTHGFSQKKRYSHSTAETCQVMLWTNHR